MWGLPLRRGPRGPHGKIWLRVGPLSAPPPSSWQQGLGLDPILSKNYMESKGKPVPILLDLRWPRGAHQGHPKSPAPSMPQFWPHSHHAEPIDTSWACLLI